MKVSRSVQLRYNNNKQQKPSPASNTQYTEGINKPWTRNDKRRHTLYWGWVQLPRDKTPVTRDKKSEEPRDVFKERMTRSRNVIYYAQGGAQEARERLTSARV